MKHKREVIIVLFILIFFQSYQFAFASDFLIYENDFDQIQTNQIKKILNRNIDNDIGILQPGDIAFKHPDAFPGPVIIDHCLICISYDQVNQTYEFIEAHYHYGVQIRKEHKDNITGSFWGPFVRVKTANETQKQNAIEFAKRQIGKEFQHEWINKNHDPNQNQTDQYADEWYCSELLWAAYYNCNNSFSSEKAETDLIYGRGIDLDRNGWKKILNYTVVAPREILWDNDVRHLFFIGQTSCEKYYSDFLHLLSFLSMRKHIN